MSEILKIDIKFLLNPEPKYSENELKVARILVEMGMNLFSNYNHF